MSVRYVWNIYGVEVSDPSFSRVGGLWFPSDRYVGGSYTNQVVSKSLPWVWGCTAYTKTVEDGKAVVKPAGNSQRFTVEGNANGVNYVDMGSAKTYPYLVIKKSDYPKGTYSGDRYFICKNISGSIWLAEDYYQYGPGHTQINIFCNNGGSLSSTANQVQFMSGQVTDANIGPGSAKRGNVSSGNPNAYTQNGQVGDRWYVFYGADSIDPSRVSVSNHNPSGGDTVDITVTPGNIRYGGTVTYLYQYSTNGGSSWTTISQTTATTASVRIPEGAERFSVRVRASDSWGFTSSDYVMGESITVRNIHAFVGVSGKARAVAKVYIGINGKAREVVKGYVGVNGIARKWF